MDGRVNPGPAACQRSGHMAEGSYPARHSSCAPPTALQQPLLLLLVSRLLHPAQAKQALFSPSSPSKEAMARPSRAKIDDADIEVSGMPRSSGPHSTCRVPITLASPVDIYATPSHFGRRINQQDRRASKSNEPTTSLNLHLCYALYHVLMHVSVDVSLYRYDHRG